MADDIDDSDNTGAQYYLDNVDSEKVLSYSYEIEQDEVHFQNRS